MARCSSRSDFGQLLSLPGAALVVSGPINHKGGDQRKLVRTEFDFAGRERKLLTTWPTAPLAQGKPGVRDLHGDIAVTEEGENHVRGAFLGGRPARAGLNGLAEVVYPEHECAGGLG